MKNALHKGVLLISIDKKFRGISDIEEKKLMLKYCPVVRKIYCFAVSEGLNISNKYIREWAHHLCDTCILRVQTVHTHTHTHTHTTCINHTF